MLEVCVSVKYLGFINMTVTCCSTNFEPLVITPGGGVKFLVG